ncbi:MAG TPA: alpha-galactosidase [Myxococcota bacterium]|nr:alpha-galactosidase [Myxococcota bacterium]
MTHDQVFRFVDAEGDPESGVIRDPSGRLQASLGDLSLSVMPVGGKPTDSSRVATTVRLEREADGTVKVFSTIRNLSDGPLALDRAVFSTAGFAGEFGLSGDLDQWSRFKMGFNTGSPSGAAPITVPDSSFFLKGLPYSWLPAAVRNMVYFDGTTFSRKVGQFESEWFTALYDSQARRGVAVGFFGVSLNFGRVAIDLGRRLVEIIAFLDGATLEPGQTRELDPLVICFEDDFNLLLQKYARAVADRQQARVNPARIWCSWYSGFYDRVTVKDIRENMSRLSVLKAPVDYIQLDDGYQSVIGDWLVTNSRFPEGLEALACEILQSGFKPGIWTAPFSVSPDSQVFASHPDWIVRHENGKPVKAGFIMGRFGPRPYYALDTTIPEVRDHIVTLYRRLRQMGWILFKVDFLTSAMVAGVRRDRTVTRAQAYRLGMQAVRDGIGDDGLMLTGIGPVLVNCGIIDIQRLSPDTCFGSPAWLTAEQKLTGDRMTPGVRNQTATSIARTFLNDIVFSGDPDAIVGPGLKDNEAVYLKTVALMTGSTLTIGHDFVKAGFDFSGYGPLLDVRGPAVAPDLGEAEHPRHLFVDTLFEGRPVRFYAILNPTEQAELTPVRGDVLGGAVVQAVDYWAGQAVGLEAGRLLDLRPRSARLFMLDRGAAGAADTALPVQGGSDTTGRERME